MVVVLVVGVLGSGTLIEVWREGRQRIREAARSLTVARTGSLRSLAPSAISYDRVVMTPQPTLR